MDEYLFLVMAKLKADRLKLQREQRAALAIGEPERDWRSAPPREQRADRSPRFTAENNGRA
jgi:hypothetical protein